MRIASTLRQTSGLVRSAGILRRRGLLRPLRLRESVRMLRVARKAGPFAAMVVATAHDAPGAPAIADDRGTLTYGELETRGNALARGLAETGIRPGDVAGILCRDHRGMVLTLIAAGKLGIRLVFMNTGFGKPQLVDAARRDNVTAMFLDAEFLPLTDTLPRAMPRVLTSVDGGGGDAAIPTPDGPTLDSPTLDSPTLDSLVAGRSAAPPPLPDRPGSMVLLTSGTTGRPRGVPRGRMSPMLSAQILDRIPLSRGGTMVLATPLFHGTGLGQFVVAMTLGKKVVLRRRFDPEATLADIAAHRADTLVAVPTMLQRMTSLGPAVLARHDTSALRIVVCGGSALSPDLCRRTAEVFGDVLYNVYGSTEVANASVATPAELRRAPGTVGRPPVGCRLALYDERRNRVTAPNRPGTIFVSTGLSFAGYTDGGHKETVDGMVCTGDIGHVDDEGLLFIDGRDDEMIVSGGENVFPVEVENLLAGRPDVQDAAVVGVDDPDFGKRLRAFVVPSPGATPDAAEIKDYVRANLARYKVPRDVVFVEELPRNATGKLLRGQLEQIG
jgi:fatty-acyl-CoA synthase